MFDNTLKSKKIGNLEFKKASYLGREPMHPSYQIAIKLRNEYYYNKEKYPVDPNDSNYRIYPDVPHTRIHINCFKNKTYDLPIAFFYYDKEGFYELRFCGARPIEYLTTTEMRENFWKLAEYGDSALKEFLEDMNRGYDDDEYDED